ncbi:MAG: GGDEF domain-containing protein [Lachnospiraceae bacterium]|nr:GGDEF domain-containing protein [Lachnospiraceae bacterium]
MKATVGEMPQKVVKYVGTGTKMVNLVLLICNVSFGILFWLHDAKVLLYYSFLDTIMLLFACEMLRRKKKWAYVVTIFVGLFAFMILAVIYLGWEYGFQQYCIGFAASLIFTDFYMYRERRITKRTIIIVAFDVFVYMALRLWTYEHPYVYQMGGESVVRGFFIANSLIGFAFLIMYCCIYSNTVRKLEYELLDMANLDPLTGICNRRRMQQMLKAAVKEYAGSPQQAVLAMLDVDYFKKVNDTYGHEAGDEVLKRLATLLREKNKENENFQVSRWGGEEFLVFYERHQKSSEEVVEEFEELRQKMQDMRIEYEGRSIGVTITIGLAFYAEGMTIHTFIKTADDKLYEGKRAGRNRVMV